MKCFYIYILVLFYPDDIKFEDNVNNIIQKVIYNNNPRLLF